MSAELINTLKSENVEILNSMLEGLRTTLRGFCDPEVNITDEQQSLIQGFFKQTPEMTELFRIWHYQQEHKIPRLDLLVLNVLQYVIQASKDVAEETYMVGSNVCRTITRDCMKYIFRNVSSSDNIPLVQATLGLMNAVTSYSISANSDFYHSFNFGMKVCF